MIIFLSCTEVSRSYISFQYKSPIWIWVNNLRSRFHQGGMRKRYCSKIEARIHSHRTMRNIWILIPCTTGLPSQRSLSLNTWTSMFTQARAPTTGADQGGWPPIFDVLSWINVAEDNTQSCRNCFQRVIFSWKMDTHISMAAMLRIIVFLLVIYSLDIKFSSLPPRVVCYTFQG